MRLNSVCQKVIKKLCTSPKLRQSTEELSDIPGQHRRSSHHLWGHQAPQWCHLLPESLSDSYSHRFSLQWSKAEPPPFQTGCGCSCGLAGELCAEWFSSDSTAYCSGSPGWEQPGWTCTAKTWNTRASLPKKHFTCPLLSYLGCWSMVFFFLNWKDKKKNY